MEKPLIKKQLETLLPRISEIFASANINFLVGSGISKPFIPTLGNIEKDINRAIKDDKKEDQVEGYKTYFENVMLPNKNILNHSCQNHCSHADPETHCVSCKGCDICVTMGDYKKFLCTISQLILDRKTTVVGKQINIFTTNIDILFETAFEDLELHYNDGFLGKMSPVFDLSNFKQSIIQRSHHYDNRSEIPVFNLLKIHGSVNWKYKESDLVNPDRKIFLSSDLSHLDESLLVKTGDEFITEYKKRVLVVNPEDAKFAETVINKYYYELLRSYSSELERENSVLFVMGFSMADQHIREITKRAARSNPTLQIYILIHSKEKDEEEGKMAEFMEISKHPNIKLIIPEYEEGDDKYNFNLETITNEVFHQINLSKKSDLKNLTDEVKKINAKS